MLTAIMRRATTCLFLGMALFAHAQSFTSKNEIQALFNQGVTLKTLKDKGYNLKKLLAPPFNFTAAELMAQGATKAQLKSEGGLTEAQLTQQLRDEPTYQAVLNSQELLYTGSKLLELLKKGYSPKKLNTEGVTLEKILAAVASDPFRTTVLKTLRREGYTASQMHTAGASASDLIDSGFDIAQLLKDKIPLNELRDAGLSLRFLRESGATDHDIMRAENIGADLEHLGLDSMDTLIKILDELNPNAMIRTYEAHQAKDDYREKTEDLNTLLDGYLQKISDAGLTLGQVYPFFTLDLLTDLTDRVKEKLKENLNKTKDKADAQIEIDASKEAGDAEENLGFSDGISSTLENFASFFNFMIDGVSNSADKMAGVIDFKIPVQNLKAQAVISEPKLYGPIRQAYGEDRMEEADALENGLDELDADFTFKLSWSLETRKLGRTKKALQAFLKDVMTKEDKLIDTSELVGAIDAQIKVLKDALPGDDRDYQPIRTWPRSRIQHIQLYSVLGDMVDTEAQSDKFFEKLNNKYQYDTLLALNSNQPQFFISGNYRIKDQLVGPDTYGFSLNYEHGFCNINSLRRYLKRKGLDTNATNMSAYMADQAKGIAQNRRLAIKAAYNRTKSFMFMLDDPMIALDEADTYNWSISAAYGFYLLDPTSKNPRGRLDFSLERKGSDNEMIQERTLITASYTRKTIGEKWSVPVALVYANKPEFLTDDLVDDKFSARIGLRYKETKH